MQQLLLDREPTDWPDACLETWKLIKRPTIQMFEDTMASKIGNQAPAFGLFANDLEYFEHFEFEFS